MFLRIAETMIAAPKLLKYCKHFQKQKRLCFCLNTVCAAKIECCVDLQTSQLYVACFAPRFCLAHPQASIQRRETKPPELQHLPSPPTKPLPILSCLRSQETHLPTIAYNRSLTQGNMPCANRFHGTRTP